MIKDITIYEDAALDSVQVRLTSKPADRVHFEIVRDFQQFYRTAGERDADGLLANARCCCVRWSN